jgi:hypothetical protein
MRESTHASLGQACSREWASRRSPSFSGTRMEAALAGPQSAHSRCRPTSVSPKSSSARAASGM